MAPSRSQEFATGQSPNEPVSLQQSAATYNSKVPSKFTPNGLNQPVVKSGNGMSQQDASRITPNGMLPNFQNGASKSTASQKLPMYGMSLNL